MREGWEIKKLGEVCEIIGGSTPKTNEPSYWDGEYYWVTPAELDGTKYIASTKRTITSSGVKNAHLQLLPSETVLLSSRAPIGKVAITKVPMYCNQGFKNLVCSDKLNNEYAYWFLYNNTEYLNSLGTGATFKEISKKIVEQISIPVPSLPEQERIVAELDCLSSVIEKQKELLKELDNLAQSIFYDMFGDPLVNEKGWEVKKLGKVCKFSQGVQVDVSLQSTEIKEGWSQFLRIVDYTTENSDIRYVEVANDKYFVGYDDIVIVRYGASAGFVGINKVGVLANNLFKLNHDRTILHYKFLYYQLSTGYYRTFVKEVAFGAAMPALSFSSFNNFNVIIPPLSIQQEFASKIEAIEKQKKLIKQSLSETETLFNSRMDYYFN